MKSVLIVSVLIYGLLAMELQAGVPILLKEIKAIKSDNQEFKNLLDLELSQGSKLDEVVTMVSDLLQQMKQDQLADDLQYAHRITRIDLDIEELRIILGSLQREKAAKSQQLADTITQIVQLTQTLDSLKAQLELLNGKEEVIRTTRSNEAAAYERRTENNNKVLAALNEIIPKLSNAVFKEQGVALLETERAEIVERLRRELGHNNPIAILVAMTSKFDVNLVIKIIEKLEHIRDAVIEGQQIEDERETVSIQTFQTVIQQLTELREKFTKDYVATNQIFQKKSTERVLLEKRVAILTSDMTRTEKLLADTIVYREQYDGSYQIRKAKRIAEIKTVQLAFELVDRYAKKAQ